MGEYGTVGWEVGRWSEEGGKITDQRNHRKADTCITIVLSLSFSSINIIVLQ